MRREQAEFHAVYLKLLGGAKDVEVDPHSYITAETAEHHEKDFNNIKKEVAARVIHISPTHPVKLEPSGLKSNSELSVGTLKATLHLSDREVDNDDPKQWAGGGGMVSVIHFFHRHYLMYSKSPGKKYYLYYIFGSNDEFANYHQLRINASGAVNRYHRMLTSHDKCHGTVVYDMCVEFEWEVSCNISNLTLKIIRLKNENGELKEMDLVVEKGKRYDEIYANTSGIHFRHGYGV